MNERIKELANQVGLQLIIDDDLTYFTFAEKFAELIVNECISEWVSLTDEEIAQAVGSPIDEVYLKDFRKVIAKLKEKTRERIN
jgi:hypothetical protein